MPFPGTVAARFDDSRRQDYWVETNNSRYLFFRSSGWITDRGARIDLITKDTFRFADLALVQLAERFTEAAGPCSRPGVRC